MKISDVLERNAVIPNLNAQTKPGVIKELAEKITTVYPNINADRLVEVLMEREKLCSTAVDSGVAIPHAKLSGISEIISCFGRSIAGIDFDSLDLKKTHLFVVLIAPENSVGSHIQLLARISKVFRNPEMRADLMSAVSVDEIYESIILEDAKF
ncbi:MAG: PTS sugar transporter subunit IIA [Deltaproteobacteria bacterium]